MNIILAGIAGRYPYGGVAWCSLMYLLGLRQLGHRVWYLEDTGECNFDPVANTLAMEPGYALKFIEGCHQESFGGIKIANIGLLVPAIDGRLRVPRSFRVTGAPDEKRPRLGPPQASKAHVVARLLPEYLL